MRVIYQPSWPFSITGSVDSAWAVHHLNHSWTTQRKSTPRSAYLKQLIQQYNIILHTWVILKCQTGTFTKHAFDIYVLQFNRRRVSVTYYSKSTFFLSSGVFHRLGFWLGYFFLYFVNRLSCVMLCFTFSVFVIVLIRFPPQICSVFMLLSFCSLSSSPMWTVCGFDLIIL